MTTSHSEPLDARHGWGRHHFGYHGNRFMLAVGARLLWLGYFIIYFIAAYFFLCVPAARRASMAYLDRLRPGRSGLKKMFDTYRHMVTFGKLLLDRAVLLASDHQHFSFTSDGMEHFEALCTHPRGAILMTAHFGNAEAAAPFLRARGHNTPINIVMYQNAGDSTERFHTRHRTRLAGIAIISTTDPLAAGVRIMAALDRREWVALRADRALAGKKIIVQFLGAPAELPAGPFVAATLSGAQVMSVYTIRTGYKKYRCIARLPRVYDKSVERALLLQQAAQDFASDLEAVVRAHPLQWANFYDFWRTSSNRDAASAAVESAHA